MTIARNGAELKALIARTKSQYPSEFDKFLEQLVSLIPDDASPDNLLATANSGGDLGFLDDATVDIHVDKQAPAGGGGTQTSPYQHPNEAIERIKDAADATADKIYTVRLGPGVFEGVHFNVPYSFLDGRGEGITFLKNSATYPALYWGNATKASVEALVAANGHKQVNIDSQYTSLVADGSVSSLYGSGIRNLSIEGDDNDAFQLIYVGVGDGFDASLLNRFIANVNFPSNRSAYIRNASAFDLRRTYVSDALDLRQCRQITLEQSFVQRFYPKQYSAQDKPAAPWNTVQIVQSSHTEYGFMEIDGDARCKVVMDYGGANYSCAVAGSGEFEGKQVFLPNLALSGSAQVELHKANIEGDLTTTSPVNITADLYDVDVEGDATIASGGTQAITMNDGSIQGALTDPDGIVTFAEGAQIEIPELTAWLTARKGRIPGLTEIWRLGSGTGTDGLTGLHAAKILVATGSEGAKAPFLGQKAWLFRGPGATGVQQLTLNDAAFRASGAFSVAFVMRPTILSVGTSTYLVGSAATAGNSGADATAWLISYGPRGTLEYYAEESGGAGIVSLNGPAVPPGQTAVIVVTRSSDESTVIFYCNGYEIGRSAGLSASGSGANCQLLVASGNGGQNYEGMLTNLAIAMGTEWSASDALAVSRVIAPTLLRDVAA